MVLNSAVILLRVVHRQGFVDDLPGGAMAGSGSCAIACSVRRIMSNDASNSPNHGWIGMARPHAIWRT
jgi:hypothetical protein